MAADRAAVFLLVFYQSQVGVQTTLKMYIIGPLRPGECVNSCTERLVSCFLGPKDFVSGEDSEVEVCVRSIQVEAQEARPKCSCTVAASRVDVPP